MITTQKALEIVEFLKHAGNLKTTLRFGSSLKSHEPTSSHSWRVALMAFLLADEMNIKITKEKAIKLALIHDLAEAITGDVDAVDIINRKVSKEEKHKAECKAIEELTQKFSFGPTIRKLWKEYDAQKTKEAQFVKAVDKIEAYLHIKEAGHKQYTPKTFVHSYADPAVKKIPQLAKLLGVIKQQLRKELRKGKIVWKG